MKLLLIHGAPATGKLTVAKALAARLNAPLVDNHAAIDMARMVFGFAKPGFWDMVHDLRVTTLHAAARAGVPRLITTAAYSHPGDMPLVEDYVAAIAPFGGVIEPVFLHCSEATLRTRVVTSERAARGKIASVQGLETYLARNDFAAMPLPNCLTLSTETASAQQTAKVIADHFAMTKASGPD